MCLFPFFLFFFFLFFSSFFHSSVCLTIVLFKAFGPDGAQLGISEAQCDVTGCYVELSSCWPTRVSLLRYADGWFPWRQVPLILLLGGNPWPIFFVLFQFAFWCYFQKPGLNSPFLQYLTILVGETLVSLFPCVK